VGDTFFQTYQLNKPLEVFSNLYFSFLQAKNRILRNYFLLIEECQKTCV